MRLTELVETLHSSLDESINGFNTLFINAANIMKKSICTGNGTTRSSTWFDNDCLKFKRKVRGYLNKYRSNKNEANKLKYTDQRRDYKKFLEEKKKAYSARKVDILMQSFDNPTMFWKEIRSIIKPKQSQNSIDLNEWHTFFQTIFQRSCELPPICSEPRNIMYYARGEHDMILNVDISEQEIRNAINSMKGRKSPGYDNVLNEMLKVSADVIVPYLHVLFQHLFNNGLFPMEWSKSIIVPIHKKGSLDNCDNFRPVSLTSLVSKIYTYILNKRLTTFVDVMNILPQEQAGFREEFSTTDHIFTLYAMIMKQFSNDRKLYVAFIDYKKCFDSIDRDALFIVLERNGIQEKMLNALKGLYTSVISAVRSNGELTNFFECPLGLKQGCLLSPKLFCIFVTELSRYLNENGRHGVQFLPGLAIIHHLLFADDTLLVSDTVQGLQSKLNHLRDQSNRLGLVVNLEKTKVMVFRKGGHLSKHEHWHFDNIKMEIVNSYRYLGIDFTTRMSFTNSASALVAKAKKACYGITRSLSSITCYDLKIFTKLFDSKVQPILSYACEVWGVQEMPCIEQVHTSSLKRFLRVSVHTSNTLLYGETGRYPLEINHKIRILKYWFRLLQMQHVRLSRQAYDMLERMDERGKRNWVSEIRDLLCKNGFGYVWMYKGVGDTSAFCNIVRERLCDSFKQNWSAKLVNSTNFECYSSFKNVICAELFLYDITFGIHFRNALIRFRLGVSTINCHRYRFYTNRNLFKCPLCNASHEDELHVLFFCEKYEHLRVYFFPSVYLENRTHNNMISLLSNRNYYLCVAKFLYYMFKIRYNIMNLK